MCGKIVLNSNVFFSSLCFMFLVRSSKAAGGDKVSSRENERSCRGGTREGRHLQTTGINVCLLYPIYLLKL